MRLDAIECRKQEEPSGRADFDLCVDHVTDARVRRRHAQDAERFAEVAPLAGVLVGSPARRVREQLTEIRGLAFETTGSNVFRASVELQRIRPPGTILLRQHEEAIAFDEEISRTLEKAAEMGKVAWLYAGVQLERLRHLACRDWHVRHKVMVIDEPQTTMRCNRSIEGEHRLSGVDGVLNKNFRSVRRGVERHAMFGEAACAFRGDRIGAGTRIEK